MTRLGIGLGRRRGMRTQPREGARRGMTTVTYGGALSGVKTVTVTRHREGARGGMTNVTRGRVPSGIKTQSVGPLTARPNGGPTIQYICPEMTCRGSELVIPEEANTPLHSTQPGDTMLRILALGGTTINWFLEPGGEEVRLEGPGGKAGGYMAGLDITQQPDLTDW
jgi:hypothetical protein